MLILPCLPLVPSPAGGGGTGGSAFGLPAAACPPTRGIWLWWLHKALFHCRAAEGGCTCVSVWQAAPEGVCKRQTTLPRISLHVLLHRVVQPREGCSPSSHPIKHTQGLGADSGASAGLEGMAATSGSPGKLLLLASPKNLPGDKPHGLGGDRRGPAGMREEDGESTPGFVYSSERAGRGLQEFSQGRHPDGAAIISKTHSSASLS